MAEHLLYPTEWPSHCVRRLIDIGPSGLLEHKEEAAKSAYTIAGFALGAILGDPDAEPPVIGFDRLTLIGQQEMRKDLTDFIATFGDETTRTEMLATAGAVYFVLWLTQGRIKNRGG